MTIDDNINMVKQAIAKDDDEVAKNAILELLRSTLVDIHRIADALEQIATWTKSNRTGA